jgi:hypothetical protein
MHWTFVQPIVFQGIVWRCSFVQANDLADTQAGQNRRLTVHIVALLRRTFAGANCLPVASSVSALHWTFVQRMAPWAPGADKNSQLLYSSETITLSM